MTEWNCRRLDKTVKYSLGAARLERGWEAADKRA